MNTVLERNCYDSRRHDMRFLAVAVLVLLVASAVWYGARGTVVYRVACSSIGRPGREALIAAALRQREPRFLDDPDYWRYNLAKPDWIALSYRREDVPLGDGTTLPKWQAVVADHNLSVRGVIAGVGLFAPPPGDTDGDGLCEVVVEISPPEDDAESDIVWWVVLRVGDRHNEIVWVGLVDQDIWHARQMRLKPIWRDENGDGQDEFVFITVEVTRTPTGDIVFKPPQTIAVFEWTSPGGILQTRLLSDGCGILPWSPDGRVPMRVDQATDLDPLVRELLPAAKMR